MDFEMLTLQQDLSNLEKELVQIQLEALNKLNEINELKDKIIGKNFKDLYSIEEERIHNIPDLPIYENIKCSKCEMDFSGVYGYVCPNSDCPMGCGPVMC